nr:MAG TPA: hypothetical protein [Caudoviricetes sp.]
MIRESPYAAGVGAFCIVKWTSEIRGASKSARRLESRMDSQSVEFEAILLHI